MVWLGVFLAIQTEDVFPQRHVEKSVCHPCQPLDIALQGSLRYWFNLKQVLGCQTSWLLFHWSFNGLYDAFVQQSAKWDAYREKSAQHCLGYGNLETVRNNRGVCVYVLRSWLVGTAGLVASKTIQNWRLSACLICLLLHVCAAASETHVEKPVWTKQVLGKGGVGTTCFKVQIALLMRTISDRIQVIQLIQLTQRKLQCENNHRALMHVDACRLLGRFFANTTSRSGAVLYRAVYADCRKLPKSAPERIALTCTSSIMSILAARSRLIL